jgi:hypothetical protein
MPGFVSGQHGGAPPQPHQHPVAVVQVPDDLGPVTGLRLNGRRAILARYPNIASTESQPYDPSGPLAGYITNRTAWTPPRAAGNATEIVVTAADFPSCEWPMNASDVDPSVPGVPLGLYPIVTTSTAQPLYSRFPIIFSSCFSEVIIEYIPRCRRARPARGIRARSQSAPAARARGISYRATVTPARSTAGRAALVSTCTLPACPRPRTSHTHRTRT